MESEADMDKLTQAKLDHDVRNPVVGVYVEIKRILESLKRIEDHLKRMDEACNDAERKAKPVC